MDAQWNLLVSEDCTLNIMTQEGADAFIRLGRPYIQTNIEEEVKPAREKLEAGTMTNKRQRQEMKEVIEQVYDMISYVANFSSVEAFCLVDKNQLECLILHVCDVFSKIAKDEKWIKTGVLQKYDQQLLDRILVTSMIHISFVDLCVSMDKDADLLAVLAQFYAARDKTNMPCPDVTDAMLKIVMNFRASLMDDGWEQEKIFKKLEATGILGQVFRCYTLPITLPDQVQSDFDLLDAVMNCSVLVKRKLKPGRPTGDILDAIIAGKDGYRKGSRNEAVMNRLVNLQKMCSMSNEKVGILGPEGDELRGGACRKCNKGPIASDSQSSYLVCSVCKETRYCSKECQKADWKEHKKVCVPMDMGLAKAVPGLQRTIDSWTQRHYYDYMKEFDRIMREKKIGKLELLLELDLYADEQGSAPALRTPPEFKVGITRRYLEGTRPEEPDWFGKGTNVDRVRACVQDQYQRMTSDHLFVIARYPNGSTGLYWLRPVSPTTGIALFSDEAMDAFSRALRDDDSRLGQVYGESQLSHIQERRDVDMINGMRLSDKPAR